MKRFAAFLCLLAGPVVADPPKIEHVAVRDQSGGWRVDVTLSHPDTGWDHYADGWRVLDVDGNELGLRTLHHPHEQEQPFTRSLSGLKLPEGTTEIRIQARCNVDGWADETVTVKLP